MHLRYISLKLTSCTFHGECGKWLLPVSKNRIQSKKDFICGLWTPEQCAAGSDESPWGDTPAVRGAATALVNVGLHSVYRQRDHVLWLYIFCGIFVTPSRQVIMWQFMVHGDFQCSHSWLEPLAKAPMKTDRIGEGRGFPSAIKDGDRQPSGGISSSHSLALFHKRRTLVQREESPSQDLSQEIGSHASLCADSTLKRTVPSTTPFVGSILIQKEH